MSVDDTPAVLDTPTGRWEFATRQRGWLIAVARRVTADRDDAEDAAATAVADACDAPSLTEPAMRAWLKKATIGTAVDRLRRANTPARLARLYPGWRSDDPAEATCDAAEAEWAAELVHQLPDENQRKALLLSGDGRSVSEIADALEVSYRSAEATLHRARKRLRRLIIAARAGALAGVHYLLRKRPRAAAFGASIVAVALLPSLAIGPGWMGRLARVLLGGQRVATPREQVRRDPLHVTAIVAASDVVAHATPVDLADTSLPGERPRRRSPRLVPVPLPPGVPREVLSQPDSVPLQDWASDGDKERSLVEEVIYCAQHSIVRLPEVGCAPRG